MADKKKILFYARMPDKSMFDKIDFYANDIKIFKELGYEVILASKFSEIVKADLYFIWWWSSGVVPLILGKYFYNKKVIMIGNTHLHDPSNQGYNFRPFIVKYFIKFSLKYSDLQIATSLIEYKDLQNYFTASNPIMLYHAIDRSNYNYFDGQKENFILSISRLTKLNIERKKLIQIIDAFEIFIKDFPEYKLVIIGNTKDDGAETLFEYVNKKSLTDKVIFTGAVSNEEKINYFHKCKLYVQPTDYEGFGMAIAESMLCGTPVVTSFKGAVQEVVGEFALNADPNNPVDICSKMKLLINDDELFKNLQVKGHKRISDNFSMGNRRKEISKILNEFIN